MADAIMNVYVTALRNTHAVEQQALQIMHRQLERIEHYPEMAALLERHVKETEAQRKRLEDALAAVGEDYSAVKEGFLGFVGNMMAMAHIPAQDEILKNTYANHAFENFEIAAYTSLLTIADEAGQGKFVTLFKESLNEEKTMAKDVYDLIEPTTLRYLKLTAEGRASDAKL